MEQTLGKRIMEHRKRLGLTQDALAERLGITAQAVSKWENDQSCPDITVLPKLAEIFGITIDELLGRESKARVHEAEVIDDNDNDNGVFNLSFNSDDGEDRKWEFHWDSGRKHSMLFAVCVLLVGITYLLAKWFAWDVSFWSILWPSVLLVYGLGGLFPRFSIFNLGVALAGGYYLVQNLGLWQLDIAGELIFPICVVVFGLSLLMDALRKPKKPKFSVTKRGSNSDKTKYHCRTNGRGRFECDLSFGSKTYNVDVPLLSGGEADCSFGELIVDLSGCQAVAEDCHIEANCSFGELCLLVPRRFLVQADSSTAFAATNFSGHPDAEPAGIIRLEADASFGEILVKYI